MPETPLRLRPLERDDLKFVHAMDNDAAVMRYWFEEPYEAFVELQELYDKHIHDQTERRFIMEKDGENVGLVELIEINHIHRRAEFQIVVHPWYQNKGYATAATTLALEYAFNVLNLYKIYLVVDRENRRAIHVYKKIGFQSEGILRHEFFSNGQYRDAVRMCIFQDEYRRLRENGQELAGGVSGTDDPATGPVKTGRGKKGKGWSSLSG